MIINEKDIFCTFVQINNTNTYECIKCGNAINVTDGVQEPPLIPCLSPFIGDFNPGLVKEAVSQYTDETSLCSESEIDNRHKICLSCDFFKNNICIKCGCLLSRDKVYMNKLALKNQSCPIDKW